MSVPAFLRGCRLVMALRARLGRGGWLHVDKVAEYPRLTRHRGRVSARHAVETHWCVDGIRVADLAEAERRLAAPPRPASAQLEIPS